MQITVIIEDDFGNKETQSFEIDGYVLGFLQYIELCQNTIKEGLMDQKTLNLSIIMAQKQFIDMLKSTKL